MLRSCDMNFKSVCLTPKLVRRIVRAYIPSAGPAKERNIEGDDPYGEVQKESR
jgi:hypothetical protein